MDKNSNTYIFIYTVLMVIIVAAALSFIAAKLKPYQDFNEEVQKKTDILKALQIESTPENAVEKYDRYIVESLVVNSNGVEQDSVVAFDVNLKKEHSKPDEQWNLPLFIGKLDDGRTKFIIPLYGKGLWGPIWGYIALDDDLNTIFGASFDHKSETPGLGAEIKTSDFEMPFSGKQIINDNGEFVSVRVEKGGVEKDNLHAVDAITGGTITSKGVENMISVCVAPYMKYFNLKLSEGRE